MALANEDADLESHDPSQLAYSLHPSMLEFKWIFRRDQHFLHHPILMKDYIIFLALIPHWNLKPIVHFISIDHPIPSCHRV